MIDIKTIKKIIDKSELCEIAWQGIDSGGELTTDAGIAEVNKLRDKLSKSLMREIRKVR